MSPGGRRALPVRTGVAGVIARRPAGVPGPEFPRAAARTIAGEGGADLPSLVGGRLHR